MKKNKALQIILYIAAGMAILYFLISVVAIMFPQILPKLYPENFDSNLGLAVKALMMVNEAIPLCIAGICLFGASGENVTRQKSTAMLIMSAAYFVLNFVGSPVMNMLTNRVAQSMYSTETVVEVGVINVYLAMAGILTSIAWTLTVGVVAIMFYETHKEQ